MALVRAITSSFILLLLLMPARLNTTRKAEKSCRHDLKTRRRAERIAPATERSIFALLRNDIDHAHRRRIDQHNAILRHGVFDALGLGRGCEPIVGQKVKLGYRWHLRSDRHRNISWRLNL